MTAVSVSRRQFVLGGSIATVAAIGLRGVVSAQTPEATPSERTVETIHGPVVVPGTVSRIVTLNFPSTLALLELGVLPVGMTGYLPALPEGYPDISEIEIVDNDAGELDLELIASLQPDLILGSDWKDEAEQLAPYDALTAIAPTALFEWQQAGGNWEAEAAGCAEAIGKTMELDALRDAFSKQAESIRTTYADVLAANTWDLLSADEANFYLYGPSSSHGKVAVAAGVQFGAAADQVEGYVQYSFEDFDLLTETGALLVRSAGDEGLATLADVATYTGLPAVTSGHVYTSDYFFPASYGLSGALLADIEVGLKGLG